ncbi:MAG: ribonuclease Z [Candidatus Aenigmarchaeota archaeon]|nr:ribonuclease Z [Candidatus Aenigmarchaeota archaeon]
MIVITFLGTVSGIPSLTRNHPAIAIEYFSKRYEVMLWDCGEGTQKQLMRSGISFMDIDNIFITHWHADHFAGLIPLIQTMNLEKRRRKLRIFAPEAERFVSNILDMGYFGLRFPVEAINVPFDGEEITKIYETRDYEILSTPAWHSVPTVAYCLKEKDRWSIDEEKLKQLGLKRGRWLEVLKRKGEYVKNGKVVRLEDVAVKKPGLKVVYSGDTRPCKNIERLAKDADVLIHDGTFLEEEEQDKAHANVKDAARIAKRANVKLLVLTHISRRYQDTKELEEQAKQIFTNVVVAKDLMKIKLKYGEPIKVEAVQEEP